MADIKTHKTERKIAEHRVKNWRKRRGVGAKLAEARSQDHLSLVASEPISQSIEPAVENFPSNLVNEEQLPTNKPPAKKLGSDVVEKPAKPISTEADKPKLAENEKCERPSKTVETNPPLDLINPIPKNNPDKEVKPNKDYSEIPKTKERGPTSVPTGPKPSETPPNPVVAPIGNVAADPVEQARENFLTRQRQSARRLRAGLFAFVLVPTALAVAYELYVSVPLYEAKSVVVVTKANGESDAQFGGLLGAVGGANSGNIREAFMAHEYVNSQSLVDDLEADLSLVSKYSGDAIDPVRRLRDLSSLGITKRMQFSRFVRSSVNVQTGLMTLYVHGTSSEEAITTSKAILNQVDMRINALSDELFADRVDQAEQAVEEAKQSLFDAQTRLTSLQISSGVADPVAQIQGTYQTISGLEQQLQELTSQIAAEEVAGRTDTFQVQRLIQLRDDVQKRIAEENERLVVSTADSGGQPLNQLLLEYELAVLELQIGKEALATTVAALAQAREKSALGRSQFQIIVPPRTADIHSSPRPVTTGVLTLLFALAIFSIVRVFRKT